MLAYAKALLLGVNTDPTENVTDNLITTPEESYRGHNPDLYLGQDTVEDIAKKAINPLGLLLPGKKAKYFRGLKYGSFSTLYQGQIGKEKLVMEILLKDL